LDRIPTKLPIYNRILLYSLNFRVGVKIKIERICRFVVTHNTDPLRYRYSAVISLFFVILYKTRTGTSWSGKPEAGQTRPRVHRPDTATTGKEMIGNKIARIERFRINGLNCAKPCSSQWSGLPHQKSIRIETVKLDRNCEDLVTYPVGWWMLFALLTVLILLPLLNGKSSPGGASNSAECFQHALMNCSCNQNHVPATIGQNETRNKVQRIT
jgi:hypothetical protein